MPCLAEAAIAPLPNKHMVPPAAGCLCGTSAACAGSLLSRRARAATAAAAHVQHVMRQDGGTSRSLQILRARNSLISRWRGTVATLRVARFKNTEWLPPSRRSSQPCASRWRTRSTRFTL